MKRLLTTLFIAASFIVACSTNALTKKSQLTLMPESELQAMGTQQYQQFLSTSRVISASSNRDAEMVRRVGQRIANAITQYYSEKGLSKELAGLFTISYILFYRKIAAISIETKWLKRHI